MTTDSVMNVIDPALLRQDEQDEGHIYDRLDGAGISLEATGSHLKPLPI